MQVRDCSRIFFTGLKPNYKMSGNQALTLSCLVPPLYRHLTLSVHIFANNGAIEMVPNSKMFVYVLTMHCAPLNHDNRTIIGDNSINT